MSDARQPPDDRPAEVRGPFPVLVRMRFSSVLGLPAEARELLGPWGTIVVVMVGEAKYPGLVVSQGVFIELG
ncbi:MAG: hypothetical protein SFX73_24670, partial [Kofleriaceae bacterium]|nr:hypothetical protein [Kofleriaceae bacterium]